MPNSPKSPAAPRRHWSLTTRLTGFYVGSVALLLAACLAGLYLSLRTQIEDEDRSFVLEQAALLRALFADSPEQIPRLIERLKSDQKKSSALSLYVRVVDGAGRVIATTPQMDTIPVGEFIARATETPTLTSWEAATGQRFLLASLSINGASGQRVLQVALNQSADVQFGAVLRRNMGLALLVGVLLAAAAGAWVARSALRPLETLATATTRVTATQLRAQFHTAGWPVELVRLADAFEKMLARLEESFDRLAQFSANLSHELRTPINNLRGETEVALAQANLPEEYRAVLESSLEEFDRFTRLIDNLLFIAKAENAEAKIDGEDLDVPREVAAVMEYYEAVADEESVQIKQRGEAQLRGDSVLFRRLLSNLLSNALRHTPRDGTIEIATGRLDGGAVEILVRDTGEGIAPDHLARIFDRFYRVEPKLNGSESKRGFGLGLSIVKSIMSMHDGTVSVESVEGKGTTVRLVFPASRAR